MSAPELRVELDNDAGSVLMALNATWVRHQIEERGTTEAADRLGRGQGPTVRCRATRWHSSARR